MRARSSVCAKATRIGGRYGARLRGRIDLYARVRRVRVRLQMMACFLRIHYFGYKNACVARKRFGRTL